MTHFNGAPTVLVMLATDPAARGRPADPGDDGRARRRRPRVIARMEALGFSINHVYGLTETYGPITICEWHPEWNAHDAPERARLRSRQGVAMLTADEIRVVDDEMRDVPRDGGRWARSSCAATTS